MRLAEARFVTSSALVRPVQRQAILLCEMFVELKMDLKGAIRSINCMNDGYLRAMTGLVYR